jgi:hypothetical protein
MAKPEEDDRLAAFQALLSEVMYEELRPDEIADRLRSDERGAPYRDYIDRFDPRCVEVTNFLMRRWGAKHQAS